MSKNRNRNEDEQSEDQKGDNLKVSKDASIDFPVDVVATEADPYHETGTVFQAGSKKANELVKRGWVTLSKVAGMLLLLCLLSLGAQAQTSVLADLKSVYSLTSDTVVNTATVTLTSAAISGPAQDVSVQIVCTEISGTTAGTITLLGSLDGTNFVALTDSTTVPAITTKTATDVASQSFLWNIKGSPYRYYRVSWTGSGTMSNRFSAKLMKH